MAQESDGDAAGQPPDGPPAAPPPPLPAAPTAAARRRVGSALWSARDGQQRARRQRLDASSTGEQAAAPSIVTDVTERLQTHLGSGMEHGVHSYHVESLIQVGGFEVGWVKEKSLHSRVAGGGWGGGYTAAVPLTPAPPAAVEPPCACGDGRARRRAGRLRSSAGRSWRRAR